MIPVTSPPSDGRSAATMLLKAGVAAAPVEGPAKTELAACVLNDAVKFPADVTGEPDTEKREGIVKPTEVTVPPLLLSVAGDQLLPFHFNTLPDAADCC